MSEIQVTLPPVLEYLKQAAEAQGASFIGAARSLFSAHIEAGKAIPTPAGRDQRYTLGLPTDMAPWCNRQDVRPAVIWLPYLSTLTNEAHGISASSLLAMVGLRLLPGGETERETMQ